MRLTPAALVGKVGDGRGGRGVEGGTGCLLTLQQRAVYVPRLRYRLVGLVVKASASRAGGPGFESR